MMMRPHPRLSPERKSDPDLEAIVLSLARRPASTPRDRLIGGAARIIELKTQINNYLPANAPDRTIWRILDCLPGLVARAPGAIEGTNCAIAWKLEMAPSRL